MKRALGELGTRFFAYAQMRKLRTVRTGELVRPLGLSPLQERELFRRLSRGRLIARVRRGLYLVPPRLPLGGAWSPDEILALQALMDDRQGSYQICGPNAFNRYGFDDQIPVRTYAYNNRISGDRTIGSVNLTLIKVADRRLGATESVMAADGLVAVYSSRVRTLVDAVYDWARFNGLPRALRWIRRELTAERVSAADLVATTLQYGDKGTVRRMGVLLERIGVERRLLRRLERALPASSGLIPLIPTLPKRGSSDCRWGVIVNGEA